MIRQMTRGLTAPMARILTRVAGAVRSAYSFDGIDDRGQLMYRAINPDGDNSYEFWTPPTITASNQSIISQNISGTSSAREFDLFFSTSGNLLLLRGGSQSTLFSAAQGVKLATKYGVIQTGDTHQIFEGGLGGTLVRTTLAGTGPAREPTALTLVGCRAGGTATYASFFQGQIYDIRINGTLWPMGERNQAIQLPSPSGLGSELITPAVLQSPHAAGNQWTYLEGGRWQLVGNGDLNDLRLLSVAVSPAAGFLEFEIESITGEIRCANAGPARSVFNTIGVKRYFYTNIDEGGAGGAAVVFRRNVAGVPASCIIKNISFKPLGTCNPLTLGNTNPDRWQEVQS